MEEEISYLYSKIKTLNETLWDFKALKPAIEQWLSNFDTEEERAHALYLLSKFMYFGASNMRHLLKSLYRDLYRYPIIEEIRKSLDNTIDSEIIEMEFTKRKQNTIFMGVGNPSESGAHLLYYFRQENKLSKRLFAYTDEVITTVNNMDTIKYPTIDYYVFIDDFCGSGSQATRDTNINRCVAKIKRLNPRAKIFYLMLFGTSKGIQVVNNSNIFHRVEAVVELDESYKCFSETSRIFDNDCKFSKLTSQALSYKYGYSLIKTIWEKEGVPRHLLDDSSNKTAHGFGDCQLLIGFHHNTPDNTLPIIWYDEDSVIWHPIFKRYNKIYGQ